MNTTDHFSTFWDIETGALDADTVARFAKPELTDKAGKIVKKEDAHWLPEALSQAALSPVTGRILAIGICRGGKTGIMGNETCDDAGEAAMLQGFWERIQKDFRSRAWPKWEIAAGEPRWVGFNSNSFDLPFVIARSLAVLPNFRYPVQLKPDRFLHRMFLDLRDRWPKMGGPVDGKLDTLCRFLGIQGKNGIGADFAGLWSNPETRQEARSYLLNDIAMTVQAAERLAPEAFPHE